MCVSLAAISQYFLFPFRRPRPHLFPNVSFRPPSFYREEAITVPLPTTPQTMAILYVFVLGLVRKERKKAIASASGAGPPEEKKTNVAPRVYRRRGGGERERDGEINPTSLPRPPPFPFSPPPPPPLFL